MKLKHSLNQVLFFIRRTDSHLSSSYFGGVLMVVKPTDHIKALGITKDSRLHCIFIVLLSAYVLFACVTFVRT